VYQAWIKARGFRTKLFQCDNRTGKYNNSLFLGILRENGITYELSPPYRQHRNGVAERMIQTLNIKARSMMKDGNVRIRFWPEAIRTTCYLHRRSPTTSLSRNRSPDQALFGTITQIQHLRLFVYKAYKHIPPAQQTEKKFKSHSRMCMMLGYVHVTNLARQAPRRHHGRRAHPCHTVANPCLRRHGHRHPTRLGAASQPLPISRR